MAIPEHLLITWSTLGAQQASADTYKSIKSALASHTWPSGMNHAVYLQGSYPNHTNIRGDSDVDIVVEMSSSFYHTDMSTDLQQRLGFVKGGYTWRQFRNEVKTALVNHYGSERVRESGNGKCIKVTGSGFRLNADVVPCAEYRRYDGTKHVASGMTFWTNSGIQIVNYPKLHIENGSRKNEACRNHYKPIVRVFKNARNEANNNFPSYFLECMLYNVPSSTYSASYARSFLDILNYFIDARSRGSIENFRCQNEQQYIFGSAPHQTNVTAAYTLIDALVELWNNWK